MNIEAGEEAGEEEDEDDHEERIVLKILHDGMFTPSGAVKKEDSKNVYSYIEKICHDQGTKGYQGGRMEEIMDGILKVWCDNIANYKSKGNYVCYNKILFNNEEALSKYIGTKKKVLKDSDVAMVVAEVLQIPEEDAWELINSLDDIEVGEHARERLTRICEDFPRCTWEEWRKYYKRYKLQWIAHEFHKAKDPAPFSESDEDDESE